MAWITIDQLIDDYFHDVHNINVLVVNYGFKDDR